MLAEMGRRHCFCLFQEMWPQPPNKVGMDLPRVTPLPRLTPAHTDVVTASKDAVPWAPLAVTNRQGNTVLSPKPIHFGH
jgi:hypothetical protein